MALVSDCVNSSFLEVYDWFKKAGGNFSRVFLCRVRDFTSNSDWFTLFRCNHGDCLDDFGVR